jgi:hypothetical protein
VPALSGQADASPSATALADDAVPSADAASPASDPCAAGPDGAVAAGAPSVRLPAALLRPVASATPAEGTVLADVLVDAAGRLSGFSLVAGRRQAAASLADALRAPLDRPAECGGRPVAVRARVRYEGRGTTWAGTLLPTPGRDWATQQATGPSER